MIWIWFLSSNHRHNIVQLHNILYIKWYAGKHVQDTWWLHRQALTIKVKDYTYARVSRKLRNCSQVTLKLSVLFISYSNMELLGTQHPCKRLRWPSSGVGMVSCVMLMLCYWPDSNDLLCFQHSRENQRRFIVNDHCLPRDGHRFQFSVPGFSVFSALGVY